MPSPDEMQSKMLHIKDQNHLGRFANHEDVNQENPYVERCPKWADGGGRSRGTMSIAGTARK
ncbi:hypothetical protein N7447_001729 [Penicillium robsamsonii]|uniref:uncharacterized protein n=1 Tax=Penicillium robsamsonii TaxID=1792511 RepID=UPI0025466A68|nr:uncharacterized protein N7447_001729 [Penicillium robsamsonii]KAJ5835703.1 hypothetical protein N7447_001729 [Penicillium robsamsonii]